MTDLLGTHDATALADLVRRGEISAAELTDLAIARVEARNDELNAVIHPRFEKARAEVAAGLPDGPFTGVPLVIKDLFAGTEGDPQHNGIKALKRIGHTASRDTDLVALYRKAGFVIIGRTNTPELGLVGTTEPEAWGASRNPWNPEHGTGGSSGGSAGAVAAGMAPVGHASDGGGSIRIPAGLCGLVGLKPSRGRIPMGPDSEEWGLSIHHAVTRSVRDSAAVLDATAIHSPGDGVIAPVTPLPYADEVGRDPGRLRVALLTETLRPEDPVDPEVAAAVRETATKLEALGHEIIEAHPPTWDDPEAKNRFVAVWAVGATRRLEKLGDILGREVTEDDVEKSTWIMAEIGKRRSGSDLMAAWDHMAAYRRATLDWFAANCDVLLSPTCAEVAPKIGDLVGTAEDPMRGSTRSGPFAMFTSPYNVTGQPAVSMPLGLSSAGLPIGVQLAAAYGREDHLVRVAAQLEEHFVPLTPAAG